MQRFVNNLALLFSLCLMGMVSGAFAACTPIQQGQVAPGDIIDLSGPDVPADQQALGVHWDYYWTVKEEDASGKTVATFNTKSISYTVPASEYAKNYYFELMVTAREAQLCINQACVTFPIVKPGPCAIKTEAPKQICITDENKYSYSTGSTPGQVNQRWWVFLKDDMPESLQYNSFANHVVGDGSDVGLVWHKVAPKSGTYVVVTGYFAKKAPYAFQGSCQVQVQVVDIPLNTITVR
jgi:hypothetical protein